MSTAPCRTPAVAPANRLPAAYLLNAYKVSAAQAGMIAQTIEDLCEMGLVEAFRDEHGIVRYKPTGGRVA
jgi:hypothetical protein